MAAALAEHVVEPTIVRYDDAVRRMRMMIWTTQVYEDALYARRAYERLNETRREVIPGRYYGYGRPPMREVPVDIDPWERTALEGQVLRYVLAHGSFPSKQHVKVLRENAQQAKRERPKRAELRLL